ncbi:type II secretion system protein [Phycisphaera mikurensis]|uniref:Prepilin-type N-terminal cleavage/methylation domain-containing protein n=1 Tax=Phycisphaera mikurensis (strain NBRC 102666 / KCTC 22515 / FYK2301M01) TaxID=1142394 RepID=I0IBM9_PHYMF|nr:prepilin-type N-terminal cleavage/methylation domain-containing protein [Phycisphaera mikurensis]MBB6442804.1 prepilin-type N-terminal cleavage/methylation domain-containing protein/prepilin-type processing-associated H-X9-DG protein [Phycisphaera mikurensis]BAM02667.1 hypothetical protein PSMK_05080 [Phycisphaera mikurensis NBRC 102666]
MISRPHRTPAPARRPSGFTLIELLVVISIIALLIGILLPALGAARSSARNLLCLTQLRSMAQAVHIYAEDNKAVLPYGFTSVAPGSDWRTLIGKTIEADDGTYSASTADAGSARKIFHCPESIESTVAGTDRDLPLTYSVHPRIMPQVGPTRLDPAYDTGPNPRLAEPYRLYDLREPAALALIFDGVQIFSNPQPGTWQSNATAYKLQDTAYFRDGLPQNNLLLAPSIDLGASIDGGSNEDAQNYSGGGNAGNIRWRHAGDKVANVAFGDGHASSETWNSRFDTTLRNRNIYVQGG